MKNKIPETIDDYIAGFPRSLQTRLQEIRKAISAAAPQATEAIKYAMPTFSQSGNLVSFGVFKNHIGFYPVPRGVAEFSKDLEAYEGSKSGIHLPLDKPVPARLISRIVKYQLKRNMSKAKGATAAK